MALRGWGIGLMAIMMASSALAQTPPATEALAAGGVQARLAEAGAEIQAADYAKAAELFQTLVNVKDPTLRAQARLGLAAALSQLGQEEAALQALEGTTTNETPLGQAVGEVRGNLLLNLAEKSIAETGTAGRWLDDYARGVVQPSPERAAWLRTLVGEAQYGTMGDRTLKVGVLLPLSGPMAAVGEEILRGLQLALEETVAWRGATLELVVEDTEAQGPEQAFDGVLLQGVKVVVGPVFARQVSALAGRAQAADVPLLALSSDSGVASAGVHVVPPLPAAQGAAMAHWAMANGKTTAGALVPDTAYGREALDGFRTAYAGLGGQLTKAVTFPTQQVDITKEIKQLVPVSSSVAFGALLMPVPASQVPLLTSQLAVQGVAKAGVVPMGTGLWQDNSLLAPNQGMDGAVFAAPAVTLTFDQHFTEVFGVKPQGLAVQGYDLGRMLQMVAAQRAATGQEVDRLLVRREGYYGTGGYIRLTPNGVGDRGLSLVRIAKGQFHVLQPAPTLKPIDLPASLTPSGKARGWGGWW